MGKEGNSQIGKIWLIGGTSESARIAQALATAQLASIVTVTTAAAKNLYPQTPWLQVLVGKLDVSQVDDFCHQQQIVTIVDASHPYASQISHLAIATAQQYHLPYLRFERPSLEEDLDIIKLSSFDELLVGNYLDQQRVLLTVGYQALPLFQPWHHKSTLFARILPRVKSLEVALKAGFPAERIIAFRPPLTIELEMALWRQWQISLVVTKASGSAGGEDIKRNVAKQLGIPLIVITRPPINYPQQTSDLSTVLAFCLQYIF